MQRASQLPLSHSVPVFGSQAVHSTFFQVASIPSCQLWELSAAYCQSKPSSSLQVKSDSKGPRGAGFALLDIGSADHLPEQRHIPNSAHF
eukprot:1158096-Pelagomonas_calceolata.AAC.13